VWGFVVSGPVGTPTRWLHGELQCSALVFGMLHPSGVPGLIKRFLPQEGHDVLAVAQTCEVSSFSEHVFLVLRQLELHGFTRTLPAWVWHAGSKAGASDKRVDLARRVVKSQAGPEPAATAMQCRPPGAALTTRRSTPQRVVGSAVKATAGSCITAANLVVEAEPGGKVDL